MVLAMPPKYQKQQEYQWGMTLGGPIIKNKLFFFINYENTNKTYPTLMVIVSQVHVLILMKLMMSCKKLRIWPNAKACHMMEPLLILTFIRKVISLELR